MKLAFLFFNSIGSAVNKFMMVSFPRRHVSLGIIAAVIAGLFTLLWANGMSVGVTSDWTTSSKSNQNPQPSSPSPPPGHKFLPVAPQVSAGLDRSEAVASNVLHSGANKVFFLLKSGATVIQKRLPAHVRTTLTRWPHHAVYADVGTKIAGVQVIDIFQILGKDNIAADTMEDYRVVDQLIKERWNWDNDWLAQYKGWDLDRFKNIPMLSHAWLNAPEGMDWFFFMDADSYVFQENLLDYLATLDPNEPYYIGRPADWSTNGPNPDGEEEELAFQHGGSGVAISRKAMAELFGPDPKHDRTRLDEVVDWVTSRAHGHCCGDALVALALNYFVDGLKVHTPWGRYPHYANPFQGSSTRDVAVQDGAWCLPYIAWHHLEPREVDLLFQYEEYNMTRGATTRFTDIYRDFILPNVVPYRSGWDGMDGHYDGPWEDVMSFRMYHNFAEDPRADVFRNDDGEIKDFDPPFIRKDCEKACEKVSNCTMWTWTDGRCTIQYGVISGGRASNNKAKDFDKHISTGWMVDRIRDMRNKAQCDPLHYDESSNSWNDTPDTSEGWFVRNLREGSAPTEDAPGLEPGSDGRRAEEAAKAEEAARLEAARIEDSPQDYEEENSSEYDSDPEPVPGTVEYTPELEQQQEQNREQEEQLQDPDNSSDQELQTEAETATDTEATATATSESEATAEGKGDSGNHHHFG